MTGIEKVTAKIIADAEADAKAILDRAEEECANVRARAQAEIDAEGERLSLQAERECEAMIARAKASAAVAKRDAVLEARARLVDEAYAAAEQEMMRLTPDKYLELLIAMLRGAIRRQLAAEEESMTLYGEDIAPDTYEVILNRNDRDAYGRQLLDGLNRSLVGKVKLSRLERVVLSHEIARIKGGLILRCGAVETNCSYEMLFAEVRRQTEARVSRMLFEAQE